MSIASWGWATLLEQGSACWREENYFEAVFMYALD
jgi:hypothetical protein